jgi:ABC-2 type transport system permease protein
VLRDVVVQLVQSCLLVGVAFAFGLRAPALGVVLGLGFVLLVATSLASLSYAVGLLVKSEDAFAPLLSAVTVPLMLLSGVLLPMALAPAWLYYLAHLNPFLYIVEAMRAAFRGDYATWAVAEGVVVAAALVLASVAFGTRTFRRENV